MEDSGGRLGGAVLVPRMIADHPWTGIGLGNYPLMRNDPHYLQGLPTNDAWDLQVSVYFRMSPSWAFPFLFTYS